MKSRLYGSSLQRLERHWMEVVMQHPRLKHALLGAAFAAVLTAAFMAYLRPSFVVDLANRIILCF
jgi:hypothetical protein